MKSKIVLLFILIGFLLYANTFNNRMFWDDDDIILNNQFVHNFDLPKFFSENQIAGAGLVSNYWRPLLLTVFAIEWQMWGPDPFGYHLINLLFHLANTVLLYSITVKLFRKHLLSFLVSLVFLIHPLQTEAVTYVSGLADPLSTFFMFLGIIWYFKYRDLNRPTIKNKYFRYTIGSYILALLSKDTAVIMPAMLLVADFFFLPREWAIKQRLVKVAKAIWPFFVMAGLYLLLRATALNFQNTFNVYGEENLFTESLWIRVLTFFRAMTEYWQLLFWPTHQHMERSFDIPHSLFLPDVLFGGVLTVTLIVLGIYSIKKYPVVSFGIFWFFARLFPNSNLLFPNSGLIYEHWMYVPMIGIFTSVIWGFMRFAESLNEKMTNSIFSQYDYTKIAIACLVLYMLPLSAKTIARNNDWQDPITFYEQTRIYAPDSYRVNNNLAMAYADAGQHDQAISIYEQAIASNPEAAVAYHNLANSYRDTGQKDLAVKNYELAISKDPDFLFSYNGLAQFYLDEKNYDKAIETLERLKTINPSQEAYLNQLIEQIKNLPR